ncbi:MAG TPA: hypothetical protein VM686_42190 [Polyangiaceae bacterium]|nr:hypothetical protein [Polyangiaceae bacterium]
MNQQNRFIGAAAVFALAVCALGSIASCEPAEDPPSAAPAAPASDGGSPSIPDAGPGGAGGDSGSPPTTSNRSRRGTACSVKNDCPAEFSCIRGLCQPTSFELEPSTKECFQIDCVETADCCGELSSEIPDKCRSRAAQCSAVLPGCVPGECKRSSDCGGGGVCTGHCVVSAGECASNLDCLANKCIEGKCSIDFTPCEADIECTANTCIDGSCSCDNPSFDPAAAVCNDEECDGLCQWTCEESRCVLPKDCQTRDDCFGSTPLCVDGTCVECTTSIDCSFDKICLEGKCETQCESDLQCALFEACQAGECIYVGCRSDRECQLIPEVQALGLSANLDTRLLRCHTEDGVGRCLIPCQTDAQCPPTEVCSHGLCEYIGCETSAECKTIVGLHDQVASDEQPWIPKVECR